VGNNGGGRGRRLRNMVESGNIREREGKQWKKSTEEKEERAEIVKMVKRGD